MYEQEEYELFKGIDHIEFYVSSAKTWSYFLRKGMGFNLAGYSGPETGIRDRISYYLKQGDINIIFTSSMDPDTEINRSVNLHGDGVRDIALTVEDLDFTKKKLESRNVKVSEIRSINDGNGKIREACIKTYGDTVHTLIERGDYAGVFPGFNQVHDNEKNTGVKGIDHVVGNVYEGEMDRWVNYYIKSMDFKQLITFDDRDIRTDYSALRSKVVRYNDNITFPINEPARGLKKSQIEEYLDYYRSEGVQHIALKTDNIIETVKMMRNNGIEFLETPDSYYNSLNDRVKNIDEDINALRDLNILVDRDEYGYLLQIFTKPLTDRPTLFFEIIERKGARSFGAGNFKALFEAIEREQARRGNL
ncbi:4-hydroxyphenylpyruvate dioxygenase [Acidiplasma aeolicum]|uniref:4-hydroxyphenylpyruvate dioxygenase n=1 Tax=Acidiplasma aeolicum TaxID=507754 RepID=A0A0P9CNJ6_9ARCH|nr:4-hydroxyphenylpyruvate dioxygenase [Acidiplasma aeolicum]